MDPTTTLMTFMLQTTPSTKSIQLVGSWDNFTKRYPMERDVRRGSGQWRGCYSFKDIICDIDGSSSSRRNGGLKMGSTYYYYYEPDDDSEIHDKTLPFTTTCPYLPGQPVNLLSVPIEVNPLRERSASVGATPITCHMKTMNPEDKYLTPRPPPPTPRALPRLNTSPALLSRKRTARSTSPIANRSPWSARALFGLRSPISAGPEYDPGRMVSPLGRDGDSQISYPTLVSTSAQARSLVSISQLPSRDQSPISIRKSHLGEPSPLRHPTLPDNLSNTAALAIPQEITEEEFEDDDANFATPSHLKDPNRSPLTVLSPPPTSRRFEIPPLSNLDKLLPESKLLPNLPEDVSPSLIPSPLHLSSSNTLDQAKLLPRSHFSIDTISTGLVSPTDSHFDSSSPSIYDSNDDDDPNIDDSFDFGFSKEDISSKQENGKEVPRNPFRGYSLPAADFRTESPVKKHGIFDSLTFTTEANAGLTVVGSRTTFGPPAQPQVTSALDELLAEMGYLGGMIMGK